MILIILSLIMGYLGLNIGGLFGSDIFMYLFGMVGVLSPLLVALELIYIKTKFKSN